jgi:protein-S-isoprenylcysteine O-methyltransferase Ste14
VSNASGGTGGPSRDIPHVIAPPPLIYLLPLAATLPIGRWLPWPVLPGRWPFLLGPLLLLAGCCLLWPSLAAFRAARTNPKPWKPSTTLVIAGPYRFTRNPMYLGFTSLYLGIALWANSLWPLIALVLVVLPVMQHLVIKREERYLERIFGEPYRAYMATVRRWI